MRIIRFLDPDGRVRFGEDLGDGVAHEMLDPQGVLGPGSSCEQRDRLRGRRAVVADDDEKMRELMATVLERYGCECRPCSDGAEAIRIIQHERVDLVVSDIVMPKHNGYAVFAAARKRDASLPVVLVTGFGYDPSHSLVRASQEGLTTVLYKPFSPRELLAEVEHAILDTVLSPADALVRTDRRVEVRTLLAPLEPREIIGVGRSYRAGPADAVPAAEDLEVFVKPASTVQGPDAPIRIPAWDGLDPAVDVEGELAVVIGRTAGAVGPEEALTHVAGYTAANDVTARRWQRADAPSAWMRGKGFDTFCPLGPALVTPEELPDPADVTVTTMVNGSVRRRGSTRDLLRSVPELVSTLSRHLTLRSGTVILTGAPPVHPGADGRVKAGDEVTVEIPGIGRLVNRVEATESS